MGRSKHVCLSRRLQTLRFHRRFTYWGTPCRIWITDTVQCLNGFNSTTFRTLVEIPKNLKLCYFSFPLVTRNPVRRENCDSRLDFKYFLFQSIWGIQLRNIKCRPARFCLENMRWLLTSKLGKLESDKFFDTDLITRIAQEQWAVLV